MNELIQQARKCAMCMIGSDECHGESCKVDSCIDVIDALADALEAAEKEIERLKTQCDINATSFFEMRNMEKEAIARAEKAEAERDKIASDMKYYLDVNEDNGVVYIPKFAVEKIIRTLIPKGE